ncbi:polysaccharide lyase family 3 protein [Armillaria luteobubalina]|uniref:Pectate lyase n=1 Tax=Armillaria luteobubalina TaxID=153913 RepID=A0AA39TKV6_9AGAR|nr:polysaccharide lyase family 3 protein [Armillaria luteobubalina]
MIFQTFVVVALLALAAPFPTPPSTSSLSSPKTIEAGESFDGGNVRFDRGDGACEGQTESGEDAAVFLLEEGASLSNVVIVYILYSSGWSRPIRGIHCLGSCTLTNEDDAITIKQDSGTSTITGGGAKGADDKVIQHNGGGTVAIDSFCVQDFGKLYRSCGNCDDSLAGINSNYGDTAIFDTDTIDTDNVDSICDTYQGNDNGDEPTKLTSNTSNDYCQF